MGLPEEAGADKGRPHESRRDEMLGEAAPPLVAEPEDRAGGVRMGASVRKAPLRGSSPSPVHGRRKPRRRSWRRGAPKPSRRMRRTVARMGVSVRKAPSQGSSPSSVHGRRKRGGDHGSGERRGQAGGWATLRDGVSVKKARSQGSSPPPGCGKRKLPRRSWIAGSDEAKPESETALGKRGDEDAGADAIVVPAAGATAVANGAEFGVGSAEPATAKPRRPLFARKGAIAVVLMTGVAAAAIMVLNWPHGSHPQGWWSRACSRISRRR